MGLQLVNKFDQVAHQSNRFVAIEINNLDDPEQLKLLEQYYGKEPKDGQPGEGFSGTFTLAEIRRSLDGLKVWQKTNLNKALQESNGTTQHSITIVIDRNTGKIVSGWDGVKFVTDPKLVAEGKTNGLLGGGARDLCSS